jgi:hypothetical protein
MSGGRMFEAKLERLKLLEPYAYGAACFLLQNEQLAAAAAQTALIELYRLNHLMDYSIGELEALLKKQVIRAALCPA